MPTGTGLKFQFSTENGESYEVPVLHCVERKVVGQESLCLRNPSLPVSAMFPAPLQFAQNADVRFACHHSS